MPDLTRTQLCPHPLEAGTCSKSTFGHGVAEVQGETVVVPGPMPSA